MPFPCMCPISPQSSTIRMFCYCSKPLAGLCLWNAFIPWSKFSVLWGDCGRFEDIDLIEKDSYLQGNTTFLLDENSLSSLCESFWYLESIMGANLLENIQSLRNGRGSTDANYLECLFVLCRLYLLSIPGHHPIPCSC